MAAPRVFTETPLSGGQEMALGESQSRHLAGALRRQPGDEIILFDGRGGAWTATISGVSRRHVQVEVGEYLAEERESPLDIHLGVCVSRGERMDWIVQKSTELGVATISPLSSERTGLKLQGEREQKKRRHWQGVAVSACEQCGRNRIPVLQPLQGLGEWCQQVDAELKLVLHHRTANRPDSASPPTRLALLVGPEGGLSPTEIARAEEQGFHAMALGPRVLRTETAPAAAIAILQYLWGDMA